MKRRTFVWISTASAITVFFPLIKCTQELNYVEILGNPSSLSHIYTSETIRELGEYYRDLIPTEAKKNVLITLLLRNEDEDNISKSSDKLAIQNSLKKKIIQDFKTNNIIIIDGWILSKTEARQCALYSLIYN